MIWKFLNDGEYEIEIGWIDKTTDGIIVEDAKKITLNLYLMLTSTMVHEMMHALFPAMSERRIETKTRKYILKMSVEEIQQLAEELLKEYWRKR